ncbi:hypothetical protein [Mycobacterium sp. URHB0044]|uniref:hypothetical protein n=1 Tax=Mycobacterium sp. URHB0044 TaxID=1380386 RepID=UPI00048C621D|nr:hypothetical protein [Mycobacterium sp. URHB0044]
MRMVLIVATSALVAGCSATAGDEQRPSSAPTTSSPSATVSTISKAPGTRTSAPNTPPATGTAIADVIRWIEAARPADVGAYHSVTRDGVTTDLGDQVAFITAGTETNCLTNRYQDGALSCLVKLTNPPPRPPGIETGWKNNWVDFVGTSVDVGSPHGDPGPFGDGTGAELPSGQSLAFGDYRCRADAGAVFCVNYAHQTAVKLSAAGVGGFGCLREATPPAGIGLRLSC